MMQEHQILVLRPSCFFLNTENKKEFIEINKNCRCLRFTLSKVCFVCHKFYEQDNFLTGISSTLRSLHSLIITLVTYLKRVSTKMAHSSLNIPKVYYTLPDYAILSHSSLLNIVHTTVMKQRLEYNVLNHLLQTCQVIRYTIYANQSTGNEEGSRYWVILRSIKQFFFIFFFLHFTEHNLVI